jgi:transcriptional regulator with XRE-family HTH domain
MRYGLRYTKKRLRIMPINKYQCKALGYQIRAARVLIGWRQAQLALAANISVAALGDIERGGVDPRMGTMHAIRAALAEAGAVLEPDGSVSLRRAL